MANIPKSYLFLVFLLQFFLVGDINLAILLARVVFHHFPAGQMNLGMSHNLPMGDMPSGGCSESTQRLSETLKEAIGVPVHTLDFGFDVVF